MPVSFTWRTAIRWRNKKPDPPKVSQTTGEPEPEQVSPVLTLLVWYHIDRRKSRNAMATIDENMLDAMRERLKQADAGLAESDTERDVFYHAGEANAMRWCIKIIEDALVAEYFKRK